MKLLATGFIQVFFVSVNTYLISKELYLGVFFCAFTISMLWSFNVKKIAFGTLRERLQYSVGAGAGSWFGLLISAEAFKFIK